MGKDLEMIVELLLLVHLIMSSETQEDPSSFYTTEYILPLGHYLLSFPSFILTGEMYLFNMKRSMNFNLLLFPYYIIGEIL